MKYKYIISTVTTFDEDEELYFTKVGIDSPGMPLHYISTGRTEKISRDRAEQLCSMLNDLLTVHKVI